MVDEQASNTPQSAAPTEAESKQPPAIVGLGASAGGLAALRAFLEAVPVELDMAFVVVQHLDPTHESLLVDSLAPCTPMTVQQVTEATVVEARHVYVAPPGRDLAIHSDRLEPQEPTQTHGVRSNIDHFFLDLAAAQNGRAVAVVLSGTGSDGTAGLKAIKSHGGMTLAQQPDDAQHPGMPSSAIAAGVADYVLPAGEMPPVILRYVAHPYVKKATAERDHDDFDPDEFNEVLAIIHAQVGHDFKLYKKKMLFRRIERRMSLAQVERIADYITMLRRDPTEVEQLFRDCLIGVTSFFREPHAWATLDELVLSPLVEAKRPNQTLRVWVAGCSTGEEAYTMAMLLYEQFRSRQVRPDFTIFATDIDASALDYARVGRYAVSSSENIPAHLRERYLEEDGDYYRVSRWLRESIVFSVQNIIADPPFSNMNVVTCRNVLIYLDGDVQGNVLDLLHYALAPEGHLMLGNSETVGSRGRLFEDVSRKWRIYGRLESSVPFLARLRWAGGRLPWTPSLSGAAAARSDPRPSPGDTVRDTLLARYSPTAVLIDCEHAVLYHHGDTDRYLKLAPGEHTSDLFALVREGLSTRLRAAIHKALKTGDVVKVSRARMRGEGAYQYVGLEIFPVADGAPPNELFIVAFHEEAPEGSAHVEVTPSGDDDLALRQLELELSATRDELRNTVEELESSNERLKTSNEEVMSMNEELQSTNEELETSKEELQSLNEELSTVNSELQDKIRSLEDTNNDLSNLVNSTHVGAVFLDTDLVLKFYTPSAEKLFNLIPGDIGRSSRHVTTRFRDPDLFSDAESVLDTLQPRSAIICDDDGQWYSRKINPYRTREMRIEGVVVTFENVSELMNIQDALAQQNQRYADAQAIAELGSWELDWKSRNLSWSSEIATTFGLTPTELGETYDAFLACIHSGDRRRVEAAVAASLRDRSILRTEFRVVQSGGEVRHVNAIARTEFDQVGSPLCTVGTMQNVTHLRRSEEAFRRILELVDQSVLVCTAVDDGADFRIEELNDAGVIAMDLHETEAMNRLVSEILPSEVSGRLIPAMKSIIRGEGASVRRVTVPDDHGSTNGFDYWVSGVDSSTVLVVSSRLNMTKRRRES